MKLISGKSRLNGTVAIPGSKSHTIRAVAIASLAKGTSNIRKPLVSSDTISSVECFRALGAKIDISDNDCWKVQGTAGQISVPSETIDVGNSGTTLRIATGSAGLCQKGQVIRFTGDEQIQTRPIGPLLASLTELGANCSSLKDNGKAPLEVSGKLTGGKTKIACLTSQYLTSLLLCCPLAESDSEIEVTLLNEPGYVQMTLDWLDKQKIQYTNKGMRNFLIKGKQSYKGFDTQVPADFSSATFFLCAGALAADQIKLTGLDFSDSQPDKAVVDYLKAMGADIQVEADRTVTVRGGQLKGIDIDMNTTPDALPAMAITACFAKGKTGLLNVPQARNKETDRIACMAKNLQKMGIEVQELPDGMIITGGTCRPAAMSGFGDHRIVMAGALAGIAGAGQIEVDTAEAMNVTFPDFVKLMKQICAEIELFN